MICGGALLLLVSVSTGEAARFNWSRVTAESSLAWLYIVVFGAIIAFTAYIWLVRVCSPALVGTYAFVNPAVTVASRLGRSPGETLDSRTVLGAAVILVAVVIIVVFANQPNRTVVTDAPGKRPTRLGLVRNRQSKVANSRLKRERPDAVSASICYLLSAICYLLFAIADEPTAS